MSAAATMETESHNPPQESQDQIDDDYQVDYVQPLKSLQRPIGFSVPELLAIRQGYGMSALALPPFSRPRQLVTAKLASKIAWNPSRLQNMILTVGPGTPASIVDLSVEPHPPAGVARRLGAQDEPSEESSSSSSSSSEEEEGGGEEDEVEEVEDEGEQNPPPPHSRSPSSSTSSSSPKRTLSNRMKPQEDVASASANLESASDGEENEETRAKANGNEIDEPKEESEAESPEAANSPQTTTADDEMMGYSDVEAEAEECRMLLRNDGNEEEGHTGDEEEEGRPRPAESTDDDGSDEDEEMADLREMAAEWFADERAQDGGDDDDDDSAEDDDSEDDRAAARQIVRRRTIERSLSPNARNRNANHQRVMKPALRHGGCINTAAWLQAGWRLSTVSGNHFCTSYNANYGNVDFEDTGNVHAILSNDCPTQLVTSGDDRLVKFWDVRYAMGSANPLPGGRNTQCPFAYTPDCDEDDCGSAAYKYKWRQYYKKLEPVQPEQMFGNVLPLATLQTGHRGNVFHVTPMWQQPGKVATCGADGYLRLGDIEASGSGDSSRSLIVVSPEYFDGGADRMMNGLFSLRPGMCFSHHFLNAHVGLLCSERGLRKFDIRLPPRQQERRPLIGRASSCKACAVWTVASADSVEEVDSTYVFVGGTGAEVSLCDLRMTGGDASNESARIVCKYLPRGLKDNEQVSVSGLDLSRDKRELLVSYESDQIYTFPIFPNARSAAGPTLEEIDGLASTGMEDDANDAENGCMPMSNHSDMGNRTGEDIYFNELASYGGHLNRFTFLKNAKYAGPNDEYICTGSDSGHAWIYERSTGAVVSLLNADHSTCNGVVPHPTLPFFITYGIDSTAKLWRATSPVDRNCDDSPSGRARAYNESPYEMSTLTRDWDTIEQEISNIEQELAEAEAARQGDDSYDEDSDESGKNFFKSHIILPDQVLSRKELMNTSSLGRSVMRRFYTPGGAGGSRIGNDLHSLPDVLRRNQYECIRGGLGRRRDLPVESNIKDLMRRVSLIRLCHQADRQGISGKWNARLPWIFNSNEPKAETEHDPDSDEESNPAGLHPADLVPDNPSDWIPYDPEMTTTFSPCGTSFNLEDYQTFYRERYLFSDKDEQEVGAHAGPWRKTSEMETAAAPAPPSTTSETAYKILHETARVLKDGGNEALREGELDVAARRYDKAIRYCSVAFLSQHGASNYGGKYEEELGLISLKVLEMDVTSNHAVTALMLKWSPLLKVLISTRLNLSMLLLKQAKHQREVPQLEQAKDQARHALRELQPFCTQKGKVCLVIYKCGNVTTLFSADVKVGKGSVKTEVLKSKEPEETYREAKTLEAKAYFRLGSAQCDMGEYGESIKSFEKSIECTMDLNPEAKVDPLVVRRLAEAKREKVRQNKRHRKKFRMMFALDEEATNQNSKGKKACQLLDSHKVGGKDGTRRRTTVLPVVSLMASRAAAEDRGTQSE